MHICLHVHHPAAGSYPLAREQTGNGDGGRAPADQQAADRSASRECSRPVRAEPACAGKQACADRTKGAWAWRRPPWWPSSGWLPTSTGSIPSRVGAEMRPVARGAVDRDGLGRFPLQSLGGVQRADDGTQSGVVASSHDVSPDNGGVAAVDVRRHVAKIVHPHPTKRKPYNHPLSLGVLRVASVWIWCGRWAGSPPSLSVL